MESSYDLAVRKRPMRGPDVDRRVRRKNIEKDDVQGLRARVSEYSKAIKIGLKRLSWKKRTAYVPTEADVASMECAELISHINRLRPMVRRIWNDGARKRHLEGGERLKAPFMAAGGMTGDVFFTSLVHSSHSSHNSRLVSYAKRGEPLIGEFGLCLSSVRALAASQTEADGVTVYIPHPEFRFPMRLSNGFFDTASLDRHDDRVTYIGGATPDDIPPNLSFVPHCLQTKWAQKASDWLNVPTLLRTPLATTEIEWLWRRIVKPKTFDGLRDQNKIGRDPLSKLWCLARGARSTAAASKNPGKTFDFENADAFALFLVERTLEQGFRCQISGLPLDFHSKTSPYIPSPERIDSSKGYTRGNVDVICLCFQTTPGHRFLNQKLSAEERTATLQYKTTPQSYWDAAFGNVGEVGAALEAERVRVRDMVRAMDAVATVAVDLQNN